MIKITEVKIMKSTPSNHSYMRPLFFNWCPPIPLEVSAMNEGLKGKYIVKLFEKFKIFCHTSVFSGMYCATDDTYKNLPRAIETHLSQNTSNLSYPIPLFVSNISNA